MVVVHVTVAREQDVASPRRGAYLYARSRYVRLFSQRP